MAHHRPSSRVASAARPPLLRKTPRQARADQTLRTLYEATAQILQTEGLEGLTTNHVAAHAGYAVGTVYEYFRNKESLLLAMAMHAVDGVEATTRQLLAQAAERPLEHTLRALVRVWVQVFGGRQRVQHLIMQAVMDNVAFPQFQQRVADIAEQLGQGLARLPQPGLRTLSPAGRFVLTRALLGVVRSGVLEDSPLLRQRELEDELVRLLLSLLAPSGAATDGS
jgi:AcrR family transcriptional regulator